jgi:hypothetical protein
MVDIWIAAHTGLPSFYSAEPVHVTQGDRVLADGSKPVLFSDPLAEPGVPTTYQIDGSPFEVTRPAGEIGKAVVTDESGRGVPGLLHVNDGAPLDWSSDVERFNTHVERWSIELPTRTGSSTFVALDSDIEGTVWGLFQSRSRLVIASARPVRGVPLMVVSVDKVSRDRLVRRQGALQFSVSWTECPADDIRPAPVVTWGEYSTESGGQFTTETYMEACKRIAGMPA